MVDGGIDDGDHVLHREGPWKMFNDDDAGGINFIYSDPSLEIDITTMVTMPFSLVPPYPAYDLSSSSYIHQSIPPPQDDD